MNGAEFDWGNFWDATLSTYVPQLLLVLGALFFSTRKWIKAHVESQWLRTILNRLNDLVHMVVTDIMQTMVLPLKEAAKDGKLTEVEKIMLRAKAIKRIKKYGKNWLKFLAYLFGFDDDALDDFLSSRIEAEVHRQKTEAGNE